DRTNSHLLRSGRNQGANTWSAALPEHSGSEIEVLYVGLAHSCNYQPCEIPCQLRASDLETALEADETLDI
ncbi:hypothetical protein, partial [Novosphingobium sp. 9U]|uniref:hypothetical protein n=1 Tax=Novosphingobium sp. 9U TaxID=2653158 RepID=UPI001F32E989